MGIETDSFRNFSQKFGVTTTNFKDLNISKIDDYFEYKNKKTIPYKPDITYSL